MGMRHNCKTSCRYTTHALHYTTLHYTPITPHCSALQLSHSATHSHYATLHYLRKTTTHCTALGHIQCTTCIPTPTTPHCTAPAGISHLATHPLQHRVLCNEWVDKCLAAMSLHHTVDRCLAAMSLLCNESVDKCLAEFCVMSG